MLLGNPISNLGPFPDVISNLYKRHPTNRESTKSPEPGASPAWEEAREQQWPRTLSFHAVLHDNRASVRDGRLAQKSCQETHLGEHIFYKEGIGKIRNTQVLLHVGPQAAPNPPRAHSHPQLQASPLNGASQVSPADLQSHTPTSVCTWRTLTLLELTCPY